MKSSSNQKLSQSYSSVSSSNREKIFPFKNSVNDLDSLMAVIGFLDKRVSNVFMGIIEKFMGSENIKIRENQNWTTDDNKEQFSNKQNSRRDNKSSDTNSI